MERSRNGCRLRSVSAKRNTHPIRRETVRERQGACAGHRLWRGPERRSSRTSGVVRDWSRPLLADVGWPRPNAPSSSRRLGPFGSRSRRWNCFRSSPAAWTSSSRMGFGILPGPRRNSAPHSVKRHESHDLELPCSCSRFQGQHSLRTRDLSTARNSCSRNSPGRLSAS
jgi:hypothetical protein